MQIGRRVDAFTFEAVVVVRGSIRALDQLSATVAGEGVTAVVGPSGSGKSTLLRLCNRLDMPTSGRVLFRGDDIATLDPLRLRRQVGMVFQRPTPFPGTVRDNLLIASPDAQRGRLDRALDQAALDGSWLDRSATALSGGEAQRVCLARTLVTDPEVLLLDEPTSALDEVATSVLERAVCRLAEQGTTVVWVSHDADQVRRVADQVLRIDRGGAVQGGAVSGGDVQGGASPGSDVNGGDTNGAAQPERRAEATE